MIYPDAKRGMHSQSRFRTRDFSKQRLSDARIVLRHSEALAKGQQAMALAMIYPEPMEHGRGKKKSLEIKGITQARLAGVRGRRGLSSHSVGDQ
jgi:hypothetical protein